MQIKNYDEFISTIKTFIANNSIRVLLIIDFVNKKVVLSNGSRADFRFKEYTKRCGMISNIAALFKVVELKDCIKHFNCNLQKVTDESAYFTFDDANNVLSKNKEDLFKYESHEVANEIHHEVHIWDYMSFRDGVDYTEKKCFDIIEEDVVICNESSVAVSTFHMDNEAHIKIIVATQGKVNCNGKIITFYPSDKNFSKVFKVFEEVVKFPAPEFVRRDVNWTYDGEVPYYVRYKVDNGILYIRNDDAYIESISTEYTGEYMHGCQVDREYKHYNLTTTRKDISLNEALKMLDKEHIKEYQIAKKYNFSEEKMKDAEKLYKESCFKIYQRRKDEIIKIAQEFINSKSWEKK